LVLNLQNKLGSRLFLYYLYDIINNLNKIVQMEKQEQEFKLNYTLDWTYGVSIEQLKKDIEELEKIGATHVNIEHGISYDCSYVEIDAICRRIETDEEFEQRKKEFETRQEQYRQRDLRQLADLKAKYGL